MVDKILRNGRSPGRKVRRRPMLEGDCGQRFEIWIETSTVCRLDGWCDRFARRLTVLFNATVTYKGVNLHVVACIVRDRHAGTVHRAVRDTKPTAPRILGPDGRAFG